MISLVQIVREMSYIIGSQLSLEIKKKAIVKTTQTNVDFILDNKELSQSIDDLSQKTLVPAANALVERLKEGNALCSYQLDLNPKQIESARSQYNGCSVRGIVNREYHCTTSNKIANLFRIDILWS